MANAICKCGKPAKCRGLCSTCYWHARKDGMPLLPRKTISERLWSRVNKTETCWLWTGACTRDSHYGVINWNGKVKPVHHVSWHLAGRGDIPAGYEIDHVCHVRTCVNPEHLRLVTRKQNVENHQGPLRNNKCGIRGVSMNNRRWRGEVRHNGKRIHVGYFNTPEEAGEAVRLKRLELHTHNDQDRHCPRP